MFRLCLPKRNCKQHFGLHEKPWRRAKPQRVFSLLRSELVFGVFAVTRLPAWWLEVALCSVFACLIEEGHLSLRPWTFPPCLFFLCLCVHVHACGWTVENVVDKWPGVVRCQILSFMATKIMSASKKKTKNKRDKILEKPSKMGKLSWMAWHGLLHGSVPTRVFMHNGSSLCSLGGKKNPKP